MEVMSFQESDENEVTESCSEGRDKVEPDEGADAGTGGGSP